MNIKALGWQINVHFFVMIFAHLIGQYASSISDGTGSEASSPSFNPYALATFLVCSLLYTITFYRTWCSDIKALTNLDMHKHKSNNIAMIMFYVFIFAYWIPLILLRGVSGNDRVAWMADNADLGVPFISWVMLPIALSAILEGKRSEIQKILVCIAYIGITLARGERFTGLIMALPLLLTIDYLRKSLLPLVILIFMMLLVKLIFYYEFSISDLSFEMIFNAIAPRLANEAGVLNTIFNENKHWQIFNYPTALFPYQSWDSADKPLVMSQVLNPGIYQMAYETGGLVTGTFVDTLSFLFGPIFSIIASIFLGYVGAKIMFLGVALLKSKNKNKSFFGVLVMIVLIIRFTPIIHSGMISSLIKIDMMLICLTGIFFLKKTKHKKKLFKND